jgi:hypothetical protein
MVCRLVAGKLWDSRVGLRGVSMHREVLSRHLMADLSVHACAQLVDCSCYLQEVLARLEVLL